MKLDLSDLNPEQRRAVTTIKGPVLVLSGPGSGKTAVLMHRIAYLISKGIPASRILAVTFTNKAAREMNERITHLLKEEPKLLAGLTMGTFHRVCARILRAEAKKAGFAPNFIIYDHQDQLSLLKRIWKTLGVKTPSLTPGYVLEKISHAKSELISPQEFVSKTGNEWETLIGQLYTHYEEELRKANAFDFDDLIGRTVQMFLAHRSMLAHYQEKFLHMLVDEFQDTNVSQARLITLLAAKYRNICVVGDEAQSIYGFRAADFRNILNFEKDYPNATIIKLEQNYRSTKVIVEAAQELITNNQWRAPKELWTANAKGTPIGIIEAQDENEEAATIVEKLKEIDIPYPDGAIFFRTNSQSRPIEEALIREKIPYRTVGLVRFYDRKEVKDILAYLRIFENPKDTVSLARIINVPARGLGKDSFKKIAAYQRELLETGQIPKELKEKIGDRTAKNLVHFLTLYQSLQEKRSLMALAPFIELLINKAGYNEFLAKKEHAEERQATLQELLALAGECKGMAKDELTEFLERAALYSKEDQETGQGITLTTVHAAKGLEFRLVFITGLEYGVFPHYKSLLNEQDLEEERRLAYVAITRAKEHLFLTYARVRRLYGRAQANPPSNFLDEIPSKLTVRLS